MPSGRHLGQADALAAEQLAPAGRLLVEVVDVAHDLDPRTDGRALRRWRLTGALRHSTGIGCEDVRMPAARLTPTGGTLPRRVAVVASASGNGKTTVGRGLARRLDVPFVELDALVHGPDWTRDARRRAPGRARAHAAPRELGDRRWLPGQDRRPRARAGRRRRLARPPGPRLAAASRCDAPCGACGAARRSGTGTARRCAASSGGRDALVPYALRMHRDRRRRYPTELARFPVVRLRTQAEVDALPQRFGRRAPELARPRRRRAGRSRPASGARRSERSARREAGRPQIAQ